MRETRRRFSLKPDTDHELRNYLRRQKFALYLRNAMSSDVISEILLAGRVRLREGRFRSCRSDFNISLRTFDTDVAFYSTHAYI